MPHAILVIDDEPQFERLMTQRFRREIREEKFELIFASNGQQALDLIESDLKVDIVLTDINMPIMDGLTFLAKLNGIRSLLKTIVVSAYGDMSNIRKAMNLGAFDFVTKPINFNDLKTTIEKTIEETRLIQDAKLAQELAFRNEKLQELDQMKSHFFTNISHELRTPLTVITGIANQMHQDPTPWGKSGIELIQKNSNHLLDLTNQILDLRKLEVGKMQLQLLESDLISFCRYIFDSFTFLANQAGLQLHFLPSMKEFTMDFDQNKLFRVLSNLLTNAIKHTPSGGDIYVLVSPGIGQKEEIIIKVKDTGNGIEANQLPLIFDRFYRLPNNSASGTGVGLALVKELVALMEGSIDVESQLNEGTTFTMLLPVTRNAPPSDDILPLSIESNLSIINDGIEPMEMPNLELDKNLPTLLIVEDNEDIVRHLLVSIGYKYYTIIAKDGEEGIKQAITHIPDIIISDVMMPKKDGFSLCEELKSDERTSHIPIILLTAKVDQESRIAGLSRGADAYLGKPFDIQELKVILGQLMELRKTLRARYSGLVQNGEPTLDLGDEKFQIEDAFIQRARQLVETHLHDNQFSVQQFCSGLGMSYSVIHRKLSALANKSPALFIRSVRLSIAKGQLQDASKTISEIAYDNGFNDPKYFSRAFSEEYGAPPSSYR